MQLQLLVGLRAALVAFFGKGNPVLEAFGFSVSKRQQLTAEQQLARKKKAQQTRKLRGTLGSRQKQAVKFTGQIEIQASVAGSSAPGGSPAAAGGDTGAAPAPTGGNTATGNTASAK